MVKFDPKACAVGAVVALFTYTAVYVWFDVIPEINECHKKGGQIFRIDGKPICVVLTSIKVK